MRNWLYENALKCGYTEEEDEDDGEGPKKKPKPRQNNKKKKGQGSKAKGSGKSKPKKPAITPPKKGGVKEFIAFAEAIASSEDPKIEVPLWVTSMVKEVIEGRKKKARFFSRQSGDTTSSGI